MKRILAGALLLLMLLPACARPDSITTPGPTQTPTPSQPAEPTPTPVPSPSEEPEPSFTVTPTPAPAPLPTSGTLDEISVENLDLQADAGIGLPIVYESDTYIIFWGIFGIFGYDLEEEKITFAVDFKKLYGEDAYPSVQGSIMTWVEATADGTKLAIYYGDSLHPELGGLPCYIDLTAGTWEFSAEAPEGVEYQYFSWDDRKGDLIPGRVVTDTIYRRDGKEWMIFQSDKPL